MKPKLNKSRALSTVLTTVIILVASVVLGSGVVLYGASLFQGGTQTESISVSGVKVWVHSTDTNGIAIGAAKIRNTGDKVVSVDKIQIRGTDVPFTQWFADTTISSATFQQSLNHTGWAATSGTGSMARQVNNPVCPAGADFISIDLVSTETTTEGICADPGNGPVALTPGQAAVIYFKLNNGTLTSLDSGASASVNIFAGKTGAPQSITVEGKE
ncbi:hypothetical protein [Nitrosarchaeum koreense]|uniref:Type IV pilin n=1 Tax=Nitrosarchaeum koreense MY1 TaxID=1001994 RepID=F9CWT5_9ARCH|nr:hypothetical protein [Nitrosarchaeum koreense]EGP93737.1 hypothetical protein MY1_0977 [Nitrosarchaeum koreense MY1]